MKSGSLRFWMVAPLMLAAALLLQAHSRDEVFPPRQLLKFFPAQIDGWTGTDETLDQETLDILGPGDFLVRNYVRDSENASDPQPWINLYIAYFPSQEAGDTIHSPTTASPARDGFPLRARSFSLRVPTAPCSPSTVTWSKIGPSPTRLVLVPGPRPRRGQRVFGQVLSDPRFDPIAPQRRQPGPSHDPHVRRRVPRCSPGPHDEAGRATTPLARQLHPPIAPRKLSSFAKRRASVPDLPNLGVRKPRPETPIRGSESPQLADCESAQKPAAENGPDP